MTNNVGERVGRQVERNHPELINFLGISGIAVLDVFSFANIPAFIAFVCLCFSSIWLSTRRNRRTLERADHVEALETVIREGHRNFFDVWDDKAREIFQHLELGVRDRLSIYKFDEQLKQFRILGRYAENAAFRERHREVYPPDQGIIGVAWSGGEAFEKKLPNPDQNIEKYYEENERKFNMPRELTRNLTMKSTCLYAFNLHNEKKIPFAIIVVESTKRESINKDALRDAFDQSHSDQIRGLMASLEFMEPSLRKAMELRI